MHATAARTLPVGLVAPQQHRRGVYLRATRPQKPRRSSKGTGGLSRAAPTCRASAVAAATQPAPPKARSVDFLVLGSGIAGLSYALKVAEHGSVAIVTKEQAAEGSTTYAQGGVCAVLAANDTVEAHIQDTMVAGDFLNSRRAVEIVCREGPARVLELAAMGAAFTKTQSGELHLTREGGHSARRVVHAADVTGREIERALLARAHAHPNIAFYEYHAAVDLVLDEVMGQTVCLGADVLDRSRGAMTRFVAPVTMLATGGAGQAYPITTNPGVATGDGMAMAFRARAAMANMEFVQFHPTALCAAALGGAACSSGAGLGGRAFLISEAVRGEGGRLYNLAGKRFMEGYDARLDLAPRDIVARAIHDQMQARGDSHVLLDISHKPGKEVRAHFPNIAAQCAAYGLDITRDPIPVAPAQHYMCGGVQTGVYGETSLPGLFAAGEAVCSGLHGANRLASNSLLEGLVFAARAVDPSIAAAELAQREAARAMSAAALNADFSGVCAPRALPDTAAAWVADKRAQLARTMWAGAGIVRRRADMKGALRSVAGMHHEVQAMWGAYGVSVELLELRNLVAVGELILMSALQRQESRGGHYVVDYPAPAPNQPRTTVIGSKAGAKKKAGSSAGGLVTGMVNGAAQKASGPASMLVGNASVPFKGKLGKKGGLIERARAREVALRSQKDDTA